MNRRERRRIARSIPSGLKGAEKQAFRREVASALKAPAPAKGAEPQVLARGENGSRLERSASGLLVARADLA